jgi:hypothetical protein
MATAPDDFPGLEPSDPAGVVGHHRRFVMRVFLGMILGALLLVAGVYVYDSMSTSTVASGEVARASHTIVNWEWRRPTGTQ